MKRTMIVHLANKIFVASFGAVVIIDTDSVVSGFDKWQLALLYLMIVEVSFCPKSSSGLSMDLLITALIHSTKLETRGKVQTPL